MLDIRKNSIYDVYCISLYLYPCYSNNLFGVVSQLVEVTGSAMLKRCCRGREYDSGGGS